MGTSRAKPKATKQQSIRLRCEALARALPLPEPFDLRLLCAGLAARRGRPIVLLAWEFGGQISGLLVENHDADYVLFERNTTPLHQRQIAIHEIAHLICGHRPVPLIFGDTHVGPNSSLPADLIRYVLQRGGYRDVEEQEAEILASLIMERVVDTSPPSAESPMEPGDAVIERVRTVLAGKVGGAP